MNLTATYAVPQWLCLVVLVAVAVLLAGAVTVGVEQWRDHRERAGDAEAIRDICLALDDAWSAVEPIWAEYMPAERWPGEHDITTKADMATRLGVMVLDQCSMGTRAAEDLRRAIDSRRRSERMCDRYAAAIAVLWEADPTTSGALDIDYLEALPGHIARLRLTLIEAGQVLHDYDEWATEAASRLPRGGVTPRLRRMLSALEERRWRLVIDDALPTPLTVEHEDTTAGGLPPIPLGDAIPGQTEPGLDGIRVAVFGADGKPVDPQPTSYIVEPEGEPVDTADVEISTIVDSIEAEVMGRPDLHLVVDQVTKAHGHHDGHPVH